MNAEDSAIIGGTFGLIGLGSPGASVIAGGVSNTMSSNRSFIGGGQSNSIPGASRNAIIGGESNFFGAGSNDNGAICGGSLNGIDGARDFGGILGGRNNRVQATDAAIAGSNGATIVFGVSLTGFIGGSSGGTVSAARGSILSGGVVTSPDSVAICGGTASSGSRTFAHGTGLTNPVGFRGVVPVTAPVLAAIPGATGIAGLDAWIASVDAALLTQGLARRP